jgi:hypothetical protein
MRGGISALFVDRDNSQRRLGKNGGKHGKGEQGHRLHVRGASTQRLVGTLHDACRTHTHTCTTQCPRPQLPFFTLSQTTLPLLTLKLLNLALSGPGTPVTFTGSYISTLVALLSFFTILLSVINLLMFDDWHVPLDQNEKWQNQIGRPLMFLASLGLMAFNFVIILVTAEEVGATHIREVYAFLLFWIGYPLSYLILAIVSKDGLLSPEVLLSPLDVICKAIFALWVVQKSFSP